MAQGGFPVFSLLILCTGGGLNSASPTGRRGMRGPGTPGCAALHPGLFSYSPYGRTTGLHRLAAFQRRRDIFMFSLWAGDGAADAGYPHPYFVNKFLVFLRLRVWLRCKILSANDLRAKSSNKRSYGTAQALVPVWHIALPFISVHPSGEILCNPQMPCGSWGIPCLPTTN
jgi:hypothetical protein